MPFTPKDWSNHPTVTTPITAAELERIEAGIQTAQADVEAHTADTTDAHDASAISVLDTAGDFTATNVEDALAELHDDIVAGGGVSSLVDLDDVTGGAPVTGEAPVWDGDSFELTDVATAAELSTHEADSTNVHGITNTAALATTAGVAAAYQPLDADLTSIAALVTTAFGRGLLTLADAAALLSAAGAAAASHAHAGEDVTSGTVADARIASTIARDTEVTAAVGAVTADLAAHIADSSDAHDASAISIADAGNDFTATDVEGALAELQADVEAISAATSSGAAITVKEEGVAVDATVDTFDFAGADFDVSETPENEVNIVIAAAIARQSALDAHTGDTSDAHDASAISVVPFGSIAATDVQAALEEVFTEAGGGGTAPNDVNLIIHMEVFA